ncbi:MAG: hypothetical protein FWH23_02440 [Bacteroidales bacterium]|nr:hypothetical protein [Bacteroidales bacterium]
MRIDTWLINFYRIDANSFLLYVSHRPKRNLAVSKVQYGVVMSNNTAVLQRDADIRKGAEYSKVQFFKINISIQLFIRYSQDNRRDALGRYHKIA